MRNIVKKVTTVVKEGITTYVESKETELKNAVYGMLFGKITKWAVNEVIDLIDKNYLPGFKKVL